MTTRLIVTGLLLVLAVPLGAEAQQAGRMYRIGYLFDGRPPDQTPLPLRSPPTALEETLRNLGYVEGRNLVAERRFAALKFDRLPELAAELVRLKPDVIVTAGNPAIAALKQATTTVPIVMAWAEDPVGAGLVSSLARPGGNITGSSLTTPEFSAKELEILNEIVPKLSRVAILRQTGRSGAYTAALESAARELGLTILFADVRAPSEIEGAFATMTRSRAGAFLILGGAITYASRQQLAALAVRHRLPGISLLREYAEAGLLLTYGPDMVAQYRGAATYIDKILKGARPGDLPVAQPTKFELVINLKTAKALGLTIPPSVLQRADEVIHP
jgi:putative tryptophan/tyrosine transport system substrate-binding protein